MRKKITKAAKAVTVAAALAIIIALAGAVAWTIALPLDMETLSPPPSPVVLDSSGEPLRFFLAPDDHWRFKTRLEDVSPGLVVAVIAYEDKWFFRHPGVNPFSISRAFVQNLGEGRIISGGSTITMQVARMIERRPRTYASKLIEVIRALELEARFTKDEILGFYFNLAPYGGNIQGVSAASRLYFGKAPDRLGPAEIALLVALPQSPESRRPDMHPEAAKDARDRVLARLLDEKVISGEEYSLALTAPVPKSRIEPEMIAPHLAELLVSKVGADGRVVSTIDRNIQLFCERKVKQYYASQRQRGIMNCAVVVMENKSRAVRAMVGSPDFFDVPTQGQVNAATAVRSPGSTLKPFLYARGLDAGIISPQMLVADVPVEYKGYSPKNYDDKYRGMVSVRDALAFSLNVPAVNLEARLGHKGIWNVLRRAGFKSIIPDRTHYGLSIILGGCGVSLLELTNLYSTLANQGLHAPYRLIEREKTGESNRLFSSAASYIVTDILADVTRPDLANDLIEATGLPIIAWKTGTSYGRRDAWSVGYDPEWTIGVWAGNATGEGNPDLVGSMSAAPLLFEIFDALKTGKNQEWFQRPPQVGIRRVCALSGMPPGQNCRETKQELFINNVSPFKTCDFHREYDIDSVTGHRLCSYCRQGRKYERKAYIVWPQQVANWMKANGLPVDTVPAHLPSCPYQGGGKAPEIVSPRNGDQYLLRDGVNPDLQMIALKAAVDNKTRNIFWFMDGKLFWKGSPEKTVFYLPEKGRHDVTCMDEEGRKSRIIFSVHDTDDLNAEAGLR